jgi:hypothetical protein
VKDLIEALTIFLKYSDYKYPTHCEHDVLLVTCVDVEKVSAEDLGRLDELGFFVSEEYECLASFRFGSS